MAVDVARKPRSGRRVVPVYLDGRPANCRIGPTVWFVFRASTSAAKVASKAPSACSTTNSGASGTLSWSPPLTLLPHEPAADGQLRTQLYNALADLRDPSSSRSCMPWGCHIRHYALRCPQSQRVLDALLYCTGVDRPGVADVRLHLEAMKRGFRATLKEFALHALSVCCRGFTKGSCVGGWSPRRPGHVRSRST